MGERDDEAIRAYRACIGQVNAHESRMRGKADDDLRSITDKLKARVQPIIEETSQRPGDRTPTPFRSRRSHKKDTPNDRQQ
jgi:preprotein translocase subunit SecA